MSAFNTITVAYAEPLSFRTICAFVVRGAATESGGMKIFSGNANPALAKDIAAYLGINLGRVKVSTCS